MSVLGPKQTFVGVIAMSANRDRAKFYFAKRPEFYRLVASIEAYSGNFGSGTYGPQHARCALCSVYCRDICCHSLAALCFD
jgi:hypothetical protein